MSYSGDGVGKLKYDVCGETKFNGVSGNGGKDLGWIQPRGWGDISASVSLMRQNLAKARETTGYLDFKTDRMIRLLIPEKFLASCSEISICVLKLVLSY